MKKIILTALIIIGITLLIVVQRVVNRNIEFRFADTVAVDQVNNDTNAYQILESQDEFTLIVNIVYWVLVVFCVVLIYKVWRGRKKKNKVE